MATAIKVPVTDYELTLRLNREEAEVLRALLGEVSEADPTIYMPHVRAMWQAISEADVQCASFRLRYIDGRIAINPW